MGLPPHSTGTAHRLRQVFPAGSGSQRLQLVACGVREWMTPGLYERPQGADEFLLMVFHQATEIGVAGALVTAPARSLIIWRAHTPNRYGSHSAAWCHSWLHCDGLDVRSLLSELNLPFDRPIPGIDPRWMERCLLAMHEEVSRHATPDPDILRNAVHTFLREVRRVVHEQDSQGAPRRLLELRDYYLQLKYRKV